MRRLVEALIARVNLRVLPIYLMSTSHLPNAIPSQTTDYGRRLLVPNSSEFS